MDIHEELGRHWSGPPTASTGITVEEVKRMIDLAMMLREHEIIGLKRMSSRSRRPTPSFAVNLVSTPCWNMANFLWFRI
jgi:hypothetical protein